MAVDDAGNHVGEVTVRLDAEEHSLDHITNGRIAFNVISSQRRSDYENYGFDELIDHGERYDRMEVFIAVCQALWSSVDADAFVWDRLNGLVGNPAKVRRSTMSAGSSRSRDRSASCRRRRGTR